ncbi:MAG: ATP-dependent Clp protease adaptor ClpS [Chloroflexi bacterium]|nr:ATP-dependent Clp protease adaptor ClpS [Chloroflexota bacterium]
MTDAPTIAPTIPEIGYEFVADDTADLEPPANVIIHNDDLTPMDFVVGVLQRIFELTVVRATAVMLEAHYNGRAHVITLPLEEAKYRVGQAHAAARAAQFPLAFTIEVE